MPVKFVCYLFHFENRNFVFYSNFDGCVGGVVTFWNRNKACFVAFRSDFVEHKTFVSVVAAFRGNRSCGTQIEECFVALLGEDDCRM